MCIICVSRAGVRQPSEKQIRTMFRRNPHGAGYMYARNSIVTIHKGFMDIDSYLAALRSEHFTLRDSVVYHFRISTQAGVEPEMTQPFPLSHRRNMMRELDLDCPCGIAHNGSIHLTSDPSNDIYSDTALFVTDYLADMLHKSSDLHDRDLLNHIYEMAQSKFAVMDGNGYIATVGEFINERGLLFSNGSYNESGAR